MTFGLGDGHTVCSLNVAKIAFDIPGEVDTFKQFNDVTGRVWISLPAILAANGDGADCMIMGIAVVKVSMTLSRISVAWAICLSVPCMAHSPSADFMLPLYHVRPVLQVWTYRLISSNQIDVLLGSALNRTGVALTGNDCHSKIKWLAALAMDFKERSTSHTGQSRCFYHTKLPQESLCEYDSCTKRIAEDRIWKALSKSDAGMSFLQI